ncbi:hypothetical protein BGX23_008484 [Mortierella sp. AD031]|nr:hypothetical protein BGX23_008484 [Mortierella sp. AD031]KAG0208080.1 hypothetical protein BGX33_006477 [Mortierella sp. NVP41]
MPSKQTTLKALLGGALFLVLAYLLTIEPAIAQDTSAAVHPNVAISAEFPKAVAGVTPDLVSGRANNLKVTIHNSGPRDLTVKTIIGSVAEMNDFTTVTHNLTAYRYDKALKAHSALILPYTIKMTHPSREVGLTLLAEMVDSSGINKNQFSALIYNSTVHFTQPASSWFDWKLILGSMLIAGAISAIAMSAMSAKQKQQTKKNAPKKDVPKMSAMDRYAVLARMKANDDEPLPSPKDKNKTATVNAEEPIGILAQKAMEDTIDSQKEKNTEPKQQMAPEMASSADRYEVLADMKATRGDDVLLLEQNKASTRAL